MDLVLEPLTPYESNVVCNANDVLRAFSLVPSPRLYSMIDICAPWVQGEPVMSYFNKLGINFAICISSTATAQATATIFP